MSVLVLCEQKKFSFAEVFSSHINCTWFHWRSFANEKNNGTNIIISGCDLIVCERKNWYIRVHLENAVCSIYENAFCPYSCGEDINWQIIGSHSMKIYVLNYAVFVFVVVRYLAHPVQYDLIRPFNIFHADSNY